SMLSGPADPRRARLSSRDAMLRPVSVMKTMREPSSSGTGRSTPQRSAQIAPTLPRSIVLRATLNCLPAWRWQSTPANCRQSRRWVALRATAAPAGGNRQGFLAGGISVRVVGAARLWGRLFGGGLLGLFFLGFGFFFFFFVSLL